jgi:hypothetical protein
MPRHSSDILTVQVAPPVAVAAAEVSEAHYASAVQHLDATIVAAPPEVMERTDIAPVTAARLWQARLLAEHQRMALAAERSAVRMEVTRLRDLRDRLDTANAIIAEVEAWRRSAIADMNGGDHAAARAGARTRQVADEAMRWLCGQSVTGCTSTALYSVLCDRGVITRGEPAEAYHQRVGSPERLAREIRAAESRKAEATQSLAAMVRQILQ